MNNPEDKEIQKYDPRLPQIPGGGQMVWIPAGYELSTEAPAQQKESHLWDYIWLVWRGRRLVMLTLLVCVSIAFVINYRAIPIYEAVAKVQIVPQSPRVFNMTSADSFEPMIAASGQNLINTQLQVLKSRNLAQQALEELNPSINQNQEPEKTEPADSPKTSMSSVLDRIQSFIAQISGPQSVKTEDLTSQTMAILRVDSFRSAYSVMSVPNSDIIEVRFRSSNPGFCAKAVNIICDTYMRVSYETKTNTYEYAGKWIDQKLYEVKASLEKAEEALHEYSAGQDALALAASGEKSASNFESLQQEVIQAERELHFKQLQLEALRKGRADDLNSTGSSSNARVAALQTELDGLNFQPPFDIEKNPRLSSLKSEIEKRQLSYDEALQKFGPEMEEVKTLKASIAQLEARFTTQSIEEKTRLETQTKDNIARLELQIKSLKDTETSRTLSEAQYAYDQVKLHYDYLKQFLDQQTSQQLGLRQRLIRYNILKREAEINKDIYNSLLQRSREMALTSSLKASGVSVVERASPPLSPSYPNKQRTILMGVFLGLCLGIGLIFFREYMNTTVRGATDIAHMGQMATLGFLPHVDLRGAPKGRRVWPEIFSAKEPASDFAENVRQLRTAVQYSQAGHTPKTILVTSSMPMEGKTTVAANLAIVLAQSGRRTILMDADLKKPSIHKFFDASRENGLSDILTGKMNGKLSSFLVKTDVDNLYVLPSGARPPNPVDLLDSDVMRRLLASLGRYFDHIILDTPPTLDLADTGVLFRHVDGVIVVVKPGNTPRSALIRVREKIHKFGGHLLGVVLNNRKPRKRKRYGYELWVWSRARYDGNAGHGQARGCTGSKQNVAD
ncbi:MAG: polysaccharide biosynthesis tyrosine autokinase [Candidatus Sumerlaeota bacterium]|nr:polysaccharide biosynthesis tyrosine autokinase [Candidatus Sumerlaeota bacterium]